MSDNPLLLTFRSPPLPFFIESNRVTYQPGDAHPNRTNLGVFDLLYIHRGTLYMGEENRQWALGPGEVLILRPDRRHYSVRPCEEEMVMDWLHFQTTAPWEETEGGTGSLRGDHYSHVIRVPKHTKLSYPEQASDILAGLHEASRNSTHASFWERQHRFLHLLQMLDEGWRTDKAKAAVAVADQAAAYLKLNYKLPVSNSTLSQALHLHANYIARCMNEVFGCTPQQFLLYYRLDQAKLLLLKTDWPIARVAEETGFRQTPHFSRLFSEYTGLPPLRFRKRFTG